MNEQKIIDLITFLLNPNSNDDGSLMQEFIDLQPSIELYSFLLQLLNSNSSTFQVTASILLKNKLSQYQNSVSLLDINTLCQIIENANSDLQFHLMKVIYQVVDSHFINDTVQDLVQYTETILHEFPLSAAMIIRKLLHPRIPIGIIDGIGERSDLNDICLGYINELTKYLGNSFNKIFVHIILSCAHRILNFTMIEPVEEWILFVINSISITEDKNGTTAPFINKDAAKLAVSLIELQYDEVETQYLIEILKALVQTQITGNNPGFISYAIRYITRCVEEEEIFNEIQELVPNICTTIIFNEFRLSKNEQEMFVNDPFQFISSVYDISWGLFEFPRAAAVSFLQSLSSSYPEIVPFIIESISIDNENIFQYAQFCSSILHSYEEKEEIVEQILENIKGKLDEQQISFAGLFLFIYECHISCSGDVLDIAIQCLQSGSDVLQFFSILAIQAISSENAIDNTAGMFIIEKLVYLLHKFQCEELFEAFDFFLGYFHEIVAQNPHQWINIMIDIAVNHPVDVFSSDVFVENFKKILELVQEGPVLSELCVNSIEKLIHLDFFGIGQRLGIILASLSKGVLNGFEGLDGFPTYIRVLFQHTEIIFDSLVEIFLNLRNSANSMVVIEELVSICRVILNHLEYFPKSAVLFEILFVHYNFRDIIPEFMSLLERYNGPMIADIYIAIFHIEPSILNDDFIMKIAVENSSCVAFLELARLLNPDVHNDFIQNRIMNCLYSVDKSHRITIYDVTSLCSYFTSRLNGY